MVHLLSVHPCLSPHSPVLLSLDALVSTFCLFVCRTFTFPSVVNNCVTTKGGWKSTELHLDAQFKTQHMLCMLTDIDINRCTMQLSHVQSGWKLKNRSFLCHPMSEVGAVFMQTSRAKNHPDISFCMPTMWPTLPPPTLAMYARHHLSTGHPPPYTLLHSTQTPSTTRDQASVRDGLAIDTKCGTKCRKGAPQTHT